MLYVLIHMHDRNYRIVVFLWKPFHVCFTRCRQIWDIRNSVVDTFAAFVILSYSKVLNFLFDVNFPARLHGPSGTDTPYKINGQFVYCNAPVVYEYRKKKDCTYLHST